MIFSEVHSLVARAFTEESFVRSTDSGTSVTLEAQPGWLDERYDDTLRSVSSALDVERVVKITVRVCDSGLDWRNSMGRRWSMANPRPELAPVRRTVRCVDIVVVVGGSGLSGKENGYG